MSDLLPATDGAYSIGNAVKGWLRTHHKHTDTVNALFAEVILGGEIPSDDPDYPDLAIPFIDLLGETPIGTKYDSYRIWNPVGPFKISKRVVGGGSWIDIIDYGTTPDYFTVSAHFSPSVNNTYDFGTPSFGWRDFFVKRWFYSGSITPPAPTIQYRLAMCGQIGGMGVASDRLNICRQRFDGSLKWSNILDRFQSVSILKEVNGITKTDIGITAVEILGAGHRNKIDLTYMDRCRVVFGGVNNEAVVFYCQIQYSTDGTTWSTLTPEASSDGTTNEQLVVGSWGNIPTGALADVYIRAVGRAANATADPTYKNLELQVR